MKVRFVYSICALIALATFPLRGETTAEGETEQQMMDLQLFMEDIEESDITEYKSGDQYLFKIKKGDSERWLDFEKGELNLLDSAKGRENQSALLDSEGVEGSAELKEGATSLKIKCRGQAVELKKSDAIRSKEKEHNLRDWLKRRLKEKSIIKGGFTLRAAREMNGMTYFFGFKGKDSVIYQFNHKTKKITTKKVSDVEKTTSGKYIVETDAGKIIFKRGEVTDANGISINKKLTDAHGMKQLTDHLKRKKPGVCGRNRVKSAGEGQAIGRATSQGVPNAEAEPLSSSTSSPETH